MPQVIGERRRIDREIRTQRGRGDSTQHGLDLRLAGLSRADRHRLLSFLYVAAQTADAHVPQLRRLLLM